MSCVQYSTESREIEIKERECSCSDTDEKPQRIAEMEGGRGGEGGREIVVERDRAKRERDKNQNMFAFLLWFLMKETVLRRDVRKKGKEERSVFREGEGGRGLETTWESKAHQFNLLLPLCQQLQYNKCGYSVYLYKCIHWI